MNALAQFVQNRPASLLFHYTTAAGIIGILEKGHLWATEYRHLNDRQEYRIAARLLKEKVRGAGLSVQQRRLFERLVTRAQERCFVLSFSERGDQLSQWRAYCPGGNGYSLGFAPENVLFTSAKQHSFNLIRCEYTPEKQRHLCKYLIESFADHWQTVSLATEDEDTLQTRIKLFTKRYDWNYALAMIASALKHQGFEEEREWRLVSQYPEEALYGVAFRSGRFGITPYFQLPLQQLNGTRHLDEIVIGPTGNRAAASAALGILLEKTNTTVSRVKLCKTPLR